MEEKLTDDGSVRKSVVKAGNGRGMPPQGALVFADFVGRLVNASDGRTAEVFDSTRDRGEFFSFTMGQEHTIPGLELAVSKMNEGEIALVTVEPSQAYGPVGNQQGFHGCGRPIPGDATLQFELQLVDWAEGETLNPEALSYARRLELADTLKGEGNTLFTKENDALRATCKYKRALSLLEDGSYDPSPDQANEERKQQLALTATCNLNLAACHLKRSRFKDAAECCRQVIHYDGKNVKARFRLARALAGMEELEEAKAELEKALEIEDSSDVKKELKLIEQKLKQQQKKQQKFYGQLFTKLADDKQGPGGLYTQEDLDAAKKPKMQKCKLCDEEVEEVQLARHIIKKHSEKA